MRVCILGDGLSGLTLAKALVNQNIHVEVLTQKKDQKFSVSRTIGISKSNTDFFNQNIINIEELLWKVKKIEIFTDNLKNERLLNFENNKEQLFSVVKNYDLYQVLKKDLFKNKYFKKILYRNKNLSFINDYELIINCDYYHTVTKKYFSKKIIKNYNSLAYTTIIKHKKILNDTATQIFTERGPLAFLPISNNKTSVVYSDNDSTYKKKENIEKLIQTYNFKYKIQDIEKVEGNLLHEIFLPLYYVFCINLFRIYQNKQIQG